MKRIIKRLSSLAYLARPLALTFLGIMLLSLAAAYGAVALYRQIAFPPWVSVVTLQMLPHWQRGLIFALIGFIVLAGGIWQLSSVAVIPLGMRATGDQMVLGFQQARRAPRIAVLSGGPGLLRLVSLGRQAQQLTCIIPVQDPVEYYYRAASMYNFENVMYLAPTPETAQVIVTLSDGSQRDIKHNIPYDDALASDHVVGVDLLDEQGVPFAAPPIVFRQVIEVLEQADAIILGPGSLFESVIPNLLLPGVREAIERSSACTIFLCNLMTEPGLTSGFSVADHIRQIKQYGAFTPDYVLVNVQRIEPDVRRIYEAANQKPVYLTPEEYEETIASANQRSATPDLIIEGALVAEADLAASTYQLSASLANPGESRTVQVLRHDPDKLAEAIMAILTRA